MSAADNRRGDRIQKSAETPPGRRQVRDDHLETEQAARLDAAAERAGSSDAHISMESVEPNDFRSFLTRHPRIELICFNGQPAEKLFRRKALPLLAGLRTIPQAVLDSTSPASARISRKVKLARWQRALEPFIDP